jgi:heat shock protein HslJ
MAFMKKLLMMALMIPGMVLSAEEAGVREGPPASGHELLKTEWRVAEIRGEPVMDESRTEFSFFEAGRITATVGCNRIGGGVVKGDGTLEFGPLMMTRMACEDDLMHQEERFAEALSAVSQYRFEKEEHILLFLDAENTVLIRLVKPAADDSLNP